jgi:uncharacterized membrane protein YdjX (TVP38/TMEM64 family)
VPFSPEQLSGYLAAWQNSSWLPFAVVLAFVAGTVLFVPILVTMLATAYLMPPAEAACCSLAGLVASAFVGYSIGRFGGDSVRKHIPQRLLRRLQTALSGNEMFSVALIRKLPVAPFLIVNIALGSLKISAKDFAMGTALGLLPAVILLGLLDQSYETAAHDYSAKKLVLSIGLSAVILALSYALQRKLSPKRSEDRRR